MQPRDPEETVPSPAFDKHNCSLSAKLFKGIDKHTKSISLRKCTSR